ncbi:hypothetical protein [Deinococcus marmoris]|uniref:hypothetical protein n=1 Tax=Deinococcus marmoris TaxID=249408 RepID=UPI00096AA497|nr:hypothetical protein [Deinococcus marmoris]
MHQFSPQHIRAGNQIITMINAVNRFMPTPIPIAPRLLGVYDNETAADAADNAWHDGTGATTRHDPWAGLDLRVLSCTPANVPPLVAAAEAEQTGDNSPHLGLPIVTSFFKGESP